MARSQVSRRRGPGGQGGRTCGEELHILEGVVVKWGSMWSELKQTGDLVLQQVLYFLVNLKIIEKLFSRQNFGRLLKIRYQ